MLDEAIIDAVDLSKLRCQSDYGLKRHASVNLNRVSDYEVGERRQSVAHALGRNSGVVNKLRELAKSSNYCMLTTDAS